MRADAGRVLECGHRIGPEVADADRAVWDASVADAFRPPAAAAGSPLAVLPLHVVGDGGCAVWALLYGLLCQPAVLASDEALLDRLEHLRRSVAGMCTQPPPTSHTWLSSLQLSGDDIAWPPFGIPDLSRLAFDRLDNSTGVTPTRTLRRWLVQYHRNCTTSHRQFVRFSETQLSGACADFMHSLHL